MDDDRRFTVAGSIWGLLIAVLVSAIASFGNSGPERGFTAGNIAFYTAFTSPFVLSLVALRFANVHARGALWFGVGVLTLLGSFVAFSGITLLFLPSAGLLLAASILTWRRTENMPLSIPQALSVVVIMIGVVTVGITGFLSLYSSEDSRCWALVNRDGHEVWESRPAGNSGLTTLSLSDNERRVTCTSDAITATEAMKSLLAWLIGAPLILGAARICHKIGPDPELVVDRNPIR